MEGSIYPQHNQTHNINLGSLKLGHCLVMVSYESKSVDELIRPKPEDFERRLKEEDLYYEEISPSIWLMNDHRWALLGWDKSCKRRPAILVHLDWHWDGINDFGDNQDYYDRLLDANTHEELRHLIAEDGLVRRESFISPAIIKGITDEVHFFCLQKNTQRGLDARLLQKHRANEFRHDSIQGLVHALDNTNKPLIVDLDLDLFNRDTPFYADGAKLWGSITAFLGLLHHLFERAEVVTIAKSPGFWWIRNQEPLDWDRELSEELARIVVPHIIEIRSL